MTERDTGGLKGSIVADIINSEGGGRPLKDFTEDGHMIKSALKKGPCGCLGRGKAGTRVFHDS